MVGFVALLKSRIILYWLDGSYRLDFISGYRLYQLDCLDWIGWIGLDHNGWMRTHSFMIWLVTASMVRMDWMGRWWDYGRIAGLLDPAVTGALEQERHHWLLRGCDVLAVYCKQGMNGTDVLDVVLVGRGLDRRTLAPAVTGALPWAPEQERYHWLLRRGALCEVVSVTSCVGSARTWSICVGEEKQYK